MAEPNNIVLYVPEIIPAYEGSGCKERRDDVIKFLSKHFNATVKVCITAHDAFRALHGHQKDADNIVAFVSEEEIFLNNADIEDLMIKSRASTRSEDWPEDWQKITASPSGRLVFREMRFDSTSSEYDFNKKFDDEISWRYKASSLHRDRFNLRGMAAIKFAKTEIAAAPTKYILSVQEKMPRRASEFGRIFLKDKMYRYVEQIMKVPYSEFLGKSHYIYGISDAMKVSLALKTAPSCDTFS